MDGLTSYRPADFVPYTAESWFALIERAGEELWPLHVVMLAAGLAMPWLIRSGKGRIAFLLLAGAWFWVGWAFLMERYSVLNWAGEALGRAYLLQALVLLAVAIGWRWAGASARHRNRARWTGLALALIGLLGIPAVSALIGGGPAHAQTFGIHPDPTAVTTIGVVLIALRPGATALALLVPGVWCALAGVHLNVLGIAWWPLPPLVAGCALVAFGRQALAGRRSWTHGQPPK